MSIRCEDLSVTSNIFLRIRDNTGFLLMMRMLHSMNSASFQVFVAPYSLRFPRIDKVRYDKPWHECLDVQCE